MAGVGGGVVIGDMTEREGGRGRGLGVKTVTPHALEQEGPAATLTHLLL